MSQRLVLSALSCVLLVTACTDRIPNPEPTFPSVPTAVQFDKKDTSPTPGEFYIKTKKNGKQKYYRAKVNLEKKTIELQTTSGPSDNCQVDDPDCEPCLDPTINCELMHAVDEDITGDNGITNKFGEQADQSLPDYNPDVAPSFGPYHCPRYVDDPHFTWRGHHFQVDGVAQYMGALPSSSGIPKGRYLLPNGPWLSDDGKARIWSGTIDGSCFVIYEKWLGFFLVERGSIGWYKFNGDFEDISGAAPGGGSTEWASYGSGETQKLPSDAKQALDTYLATGECTPGWVIIVDNARVC